MTSERTLGNRAVRVTLARAALDELTLAVADGAFELAKSIVSGAHVPDAAPFGVGLVQGGGVIAFVGSKRVGVFSTGPELPFAKPRDAKLSKGITVIGGFGFPGRFQESGTIKEPARPFLTPAVMEGVPGAENFIRLACIKRGVINSSRRALGDVYGADVSKEVRQEVGAIKRAVNQVGS